MIIIAHAVNVCYVHALTDVQDTGPKLCHIQTLFSKSDISHSTTVVRSGRDQEMHVQFLYATLDVKMEDVSIPILAHAMLDFMASYANTTSMNAPRSLARKYATTCLEPTLVRAKLDSLNQVRPQQMVVATMLTNVKSLLANVLQTQEVA